MIVWNKGVVILAFHLPHYAFTAHQLGDKVAVSRFVDAVIVNEACHCDIILQANGREVAQEAHSPSQLKPLKSCNGASSPFAKQANEGGAVHAVHATQDNSSSHSGGRNITLGRQQVREAVAVRGSE